MKFGREQAERMLAFGGIGPDDEHYGFLVALLTDIMRRETRRAEAIARIGAKIKARSSDAEAHRLAGLLAEEKPSGGLMLQVSRAFVVLSKLTVREGERQSANRERAQTARNERISSRFRKLNGSMSGRAAARKIRCEMKLTISEDRIRRIGRNTK